MEDKKSFFLAIYSKLKRDMFYYLTLNILFHIRFSLFMEFFQGFEFDNVFLCLKFVLMSTLHRLSRSFEEKENYFCEFLQSWCLKFVLMLTLCRFRRPLE